MLRYGLYTRKSHDDKKLTEKSTGEQLAECKALAQRDGLTVAWECEESKSAKVPGQRPKYSELIQSIERGRIDGVLCWHVNRLVRNMEEGGKLVQLLIDGKVKEIRTPHSVYRSGENILAVVIEAASATQHSIDLVHTVKRSSHGNFVAGGWNHRAPPGYRNIRDPLNSKRGQVELDSDRSLLIRKAWEAMLQGETNIVKVTNLLRNWGYLSKPTLNRPARPLSYAAVRAMLLNPFYAGFVREKGELVKGRHSALVTVSEFQKVQAQLAQRAFTAQRKHYHAYTGFMKCGYCGLSVTAETKRTGAGMWEGYHCSDPYNRCTKRGMSKASVETKLAECLGTLAIAPDVLEIGMEVIRSGIEAQRLVLEARRHEQNRALESVKRSLERLTDMWLSGLLTDEETYRTKERALLAEKERMQLETSTGRSATEQMTLNMTVAREMIPRARQKLATAPPEVKRKIAEALGSFTFYGKEKQIVLRLHPALHGIVTFLSSNKGSLESFIKVSSNQKEAAFQKQLLFGGRESNGIEVPESLFVALASDDLTLPPGFEMEAAENPDLRRTA